MFEPRRDGVNVRLSTIPTPLIRDPEDQPAACSSFSLLVLSDFQPVWWSIATVVVVFTASAAFFVRSLTEWRKSRNLDEQSADSSLP